MAETSAGGLLLTSMDKLICIQDVLHCFNNSISEEQAWAVCYQCAQYFLQNPSQDKFRDIYYHGTTAIKLSSDGDLIIDGSYNEGSGKGPPQNRISFSSSQEFKGTLTPIDVTQALGTAIYKALDFGLPEEEEPHLSGELEELIESLTDHPTDDDEGIDIERDSDDSQGGKEHSVFQDIIECCEGHLTGKQNAAVHYKAVCRALATEAKELLTFLDIIASGQAKLAKVRRKDADDGLDDLERSDWARLWVQIMGELRHGCRLKKVEQVHLPRVEFELTPFEILLEDIRTRRYNLNRIMVNGDIPQKVKSDAHAVILDFIRSRPPLKPVNRRKLKKAPVREMEPREQLLDEIRKPHNLKPVRKGKLVVGARRSLLEGDDYDYDSDEDKSKSSRKVIKPVAAFQVSTDDSDSFFSDSDEDDRQHVAAPDMSPLSPVEPHGWRQTVTKDMVSQPSSCRNITRRHTISACDTKNGKKVHRQAQPSPLMEEDEGEEMLHDDSFVRGHASRRPTKMVSYRQQHGDPVHAHNVVTVAGDDHNDYRPRSPMKHAGHCVMSKSHGSLVDSSLVNPHHSHLHDTCSRKLSSSHRSHSLASVDAPQRSGSPVRHVRSMSPNCRHAGRAESPVRHLSRSETFTYSTPHSSRTCTRNEVYMAARCDSPQSRQMVRSDSFPSSRCESPHSQHRPESPRRHSVQHVHADVSRAVPERSRRHSMQHVHNNHPARDARDARDAREAAPRSSSPVIRARPVQRRASVACERQSKHDHCDSSRGRHVVSEHSEGHHGNRSSSQSPSSHGYQASPDLVEHTTKSSNSALQARRTSLNRQESGEATSSDGRQGQRSRPSIIRARSKPELRTNKSILKEEEDKHFAFIEKTKPQQSADAQPSATDGNFKRPTSSRVPRSSVIRAGVDRHRESSSNKSPTDADDTSDTSREETRTRTNVSLSRQSAIRTGQRSDPRSKVLAKSVSFDSDAKDIDKQRESRTRRVGVVSHEKTASSEQASEKVLANSLATRPTNLRQEVTSSSTSSLRKQEVTSQRNTEQKGPKEADSTPRRSAVPRHEFKQVRPIIRSRSEVRSSRPEIKPFKGSHDLHVDFDLVTSDPSKTDSAPVVPGFSEPDLLSMEPDLLDHDVPDVIKTSRSEFKVKDLLHVSWRSDVADQDTNQALTPSGSLHPLPHKWQNPIECLSLTLEEITHIRMVLTKAELEGLITDRELYTLVAKGKVCFTCKKTKFSLFGQWGTKCKFCQRNVCNYCLRKMSVPTEHFEKIPVYTLSPVPISPEIMDALKVYESTGSVPHSPISTRKQLEKASPKQSPQEEPVVSPSDESRIAAKRRTLQRSHTIGVGSTRPPPNKALLKGPQMSICCDCKSMIMEIIRASRSSVSVVTGKEDSGDGRAMTPTASIRDDQAVLRPRTLADDRERPRSMLANFNFKSFNFTKTDTDA